MSKIAKSNGMMGFGSNVYSKLDGLFHDDEKEFFIKCEDKYIKEAFKKYLQDNNFEYKDSNIKNQYIFVSTVLGSFKFTDEASSNIDYNIPIDWEDVVMKINNIIEENPIEKKQKVNKNPDNWNLPASEQPDTPQVNTIQKKGNTETKELKSKVYRKFENETIVVFGSCVGSGSSDIQITDDETSFDLYIGDKKKSNGRWNWSSDGFVSIMKPQEFMDEIERVIDEHKGYGNYDEEDIFSIQDAFIVDNFTGELRVGGLCEDDTTTDKFSFDDYICHYNDEDEGKSIWSVFLQLPQGTNIRPIDMSKPSIIKNLFRNQKIDSIIDSETEMGDDVR